jgi:hypothetical protein
LRSGATTVEGEFVALSAHRGFLRSILRFGVCLKTGKIPAY